MTWVMSGLAFLVLAAALILLGRVDLIVSFVLGGIAGTSIALVAKRRKGR